MPRWREIGDISASCRIDIKPRGGNRARVDGSALAGQCVKALRPQRARLGVTLPWRAGVRTAGIVRACVRLLMRGKRTTDAIDGSQRPDPGVKRVPTRIGRAAVLARCEADTQSPRRQPGASNCLTPDASIRHCAKRQRIKAVMQALIYQAGRIIDTGSRLILALAANDRGARVFSRLGPNGRTDIDCRTQRRRRHGPEGANRLTQHAQGNFDAPRRCIAHQATTEVRPQGHVRG